MASLAARTATHHCLVVSQRPFSHRVGPRRGATTVRASAFENLINKVTVAVQKSPLAEGKKALAKLQAGEYDEAAVKNAIDGIIAGDKVVVFSFSTCPFCIRAKKELDAMGVSYKAIELNEMGKEGMAMRAELAERTGRTSVPSIWIEGIPIGGCNDGPGLLTLKANGELEPMLRAAGAL
jgi:glutaredoxin 3